jgi:antitoxin component YwqK of YwqJK toxin-antitoxin module
MMLRPVILLLIFSCTTHRETVTTKGRAITIEASDSSMHFINGELYHGEELFTGIFLERYKTDTIYRQKNYITGKEEGWALSYFPDGSLSEKRYYRNGEKDSIHTGWWPNGKQRFEYHFKSGLYNGDFKEWYSGGEAYKHISYSDGRENRGKGWRQNGKVFMNFIVKNGRRYGLENSNLCYTLKNEKGEYVNSVEN